jgi:hypothetical protein
LLRLAKYNRELAILRHEKFEPGIIGKLENQESRLWSIEQIIHQKTRKFIKNYFPHGAIQTLPEHYDLRKNLYKLKKGKWVIDP